MHIFVAANAIDAFYFFAAKQQVMELATVILHSSHEETINDFNYKFPLTHGQPQLCMYIHMYSE